MDLNALESDQTQSPYPKGIHAVSVGSMLFDPDFFHLATEARPDITFHAIGCGIDPGLLPKSTIYYKEKPYAETLPYLRHAAFGIAPYRSGKTPYYLCDTSMKLRQYAFLGLPAVCPEFAVGNHNSSRFGYVVGDKSSIAEAIQKALIAPRTRSEDFLSWSEVVAQMTSTNEVAAT
jgi:2-beta-glucuronyltransferase